MTDTVDTPGRAKLSWKEKMELKEKKKQEEEKKKQQEEEKFLFKMKGKVKAYHAIHEGEDIDPTNEEEVAALAEHDEHKLTYAEKMTLRRKRDEERRKREEKKEKEWAEKVGLQVHNFKASRGDEKDRTDAEEKLKRMMHELGVEDYEQDGALSEDAVNRLTERVHQRLAKNNETRDREREDEANEEAAPAPAADESASEEEEVQAAPAPKKMSKLEAKLAAKGTQRVGVTPRDDSNY